MKGTVTTWPLGAVSRKSRQVAAAWKAQSNQLPDTDEFTRDILRAIQGIPLRRLAAATTLSLRYCALIRSGQRVPRPRHWPLLANAAGEEPGPRARCR